MRTSLLVLAVLISGVWTTHSGWARAAEPVGAAGPFLVAPYLQLGDVYSLEENDSTLLVFHAAAEDADWRVELMRSGETEWQPVDYHRYRTVKVNGLAPFRIYRWWLTRLKLGGEYRYRVFRNGTSVFESKAKARTSPSQPTVAAIFGDSGTGRLEQRKIAFRSHQLNPDFMMSTGDTLQGSGRLSEYLTHYFPIYNADEPSADGGVPLLRARLSFTCLGNHDAGNPNYDQMPDGGGYYINWFLPRNGPMRRHGGTNTMKLRGAEANLQAFLDAADGKYPKMGHYSFDYGNTHWTVIDSNGYVDVSDFEMRNWLDRDLAAAEKATWKFVVFHESGFHSSPRNAFENQKTRIYSDIFQHRKVDVVFSGHIHNYQRSHPLVFRAVTRTNGRIKGPEWGERGRFIVDGDAWPDTSYDGAKNRTPNGIIYIVTGAGGAGLYGPEQTNRPETWQPFTAKLIADVHSFTALRADGNLLTIRQIDLEGNEIDGFVIEKGAVQPSKEEKP